MVTIGSWLPSTEIDPPPLITPASVPLERFNCRFELRLLIALVIFGLAANGVPRLGSRSVLRMHVPALLAVPTKIGRDRSVTPRPSRSSAELPGDDARKMLPV